MEVWPPHVRGAPTAATCASRYEAREAALDFFPDPCGRCRCRSITLVACKMPQPKAARIMGKVARGGRGAATLWRAAASSSSGTEGGRDLKYRPPGEIAAVLSHLCGPDYAYHRRRCTFSSSSSLSRLQRGCRGQKAARLLTWWWAKVDGGPCGCYRCRHPPQNHKVHVTFDSGMRCLRFG